MTSTAFNLMSCWTKEDDWTYSSSFLIFFFKRYFSGILWWIETQKQGEQLGEWHNGIKSKIFASQESNWWSLFFLLLRLPSNQLFPRLLRKHACFPWSESKMQLILLRSWSVISGRSCLVTSLSPRRKDWFCARCCDTSATAQRHVRNLRWHSLNWHNDRSTQMYVWRRSVWHSRSDPMVTAHLLGLPQLLG